MHEAVNFIEEAIGEFPNADDNGASKANAFGLLITPMIRHAISGNVPLALVDAPQAGTGKSLLAEVISVITTGNVAAPKQAPRDGDEWRKAITAELKVEKIAEVTIQGPERSAEVFIAPGLIDIQLNGFAGVNFSDPELRPEQLIPLIPKIWKTGVTSFCPTLITNLFESLKRNFRIFEEVRRADARLARTIPCYHVEGPYISRKAKGTGTSRP